MIGATYRRQARSTDRMALKAASFGVVDTSGWALGACLVNASLTPRHWKLSR